MPIFSRACFASASTPPDNYEVIWFASLVTLFIIALWINISKASNEEKKYYIIQNIVLKKLKMIIFKMNIHTAMLIELLHFLNCTLSFMPSFILIGQFLHESINRIAIIYKWKKNNYAGKLHFLNSYHHCFPKTTKN